MTPRKQHQRSHKRRGSSNTGVGHLTHVPQRLESHHDPACEEELRKWQAEESQGRSPQRVLESVAKRLRSNPETLHLWGAFEKYTQQLRQGRAIRRMTWALELHNEKTLSTGEVWVHTHLMFDCLGTTVSLSRNSGLTFMNTYPHTSADCVKAQGRAVKKAFDQGHKTGRDILRGQCDPESKLFCEPRVGHAMMAAEQDHERDSCLRVRQVQTARAKITGEPGVPRESGAAGEARCLETKGGRGHETPHEEDSSVDEEFLPQFGHAMLHRKFLVLDGPSRLGKALFTYSLCKDVSQTLETNCSRCREPNLKGFDPATYRCILFDEAKAAMVVEHKGLFQGRNTWVDMATSGTNCYSYKVWTHGTMLVVTSNKWQTELEALPKADADWLVQNSVYVHVQTPLYE